MLLLIAIVTVFDTTAQVAYKKVYGKKASYSVSIPAEYTPKKSVGENIDLNFIDSKGASIIVVIRQLPSGISEKNINDMLLIPENDFVNDLEAMGLENVTILKRGIRNINNVDSYYSYFTSNILYHHSIAQFRNGKLINLQFSCPKSLKDVYMPHIFRVVNSLKT